MPFNCQHTSLSDQILLNSMLALFLAITGLLGTSEWRFHRRSLGYIGHTTGQILSQQATDGGIVLTRIESHHTGLQILEHTPNAIDVLGEYITGQSHAGIVC